MEDRRLLAVFTVSSLNDSGNGSLRDAIAQANALSGADTIDFAATMSGGTITLSSGEIQISQGLTIDAGAFAQNVTINANQLSRIFNYTATNGNLMLAGLTLIGGKTTANSLEGGGGAIRMFTGNLTLDRCTVSGNSTTGFGGGVFASAGVVTLTRSTVSGNSTTGPSGDGGGIWGIYSVALTQSTVSGNSTAGNFADGGGIFAVEGVMLAQSTVSGNSTAGNTADGGGIFTYGDVSLTQSTVSGNSVAGDSARGGGIYAREATLTQSTLSGNSTSGSHGDGGGIWCPGDMDLTQTTVSENVASGSGARGGGIFHDGNFPISITGSIVARNTASGAADLFSRPQSTLNVNYSLVGVADGLVLAGNVGNLTGTAAAPLDPRLAPLGDNGGPTTTHALLPGSPAINAGDPSYVGPANYDQRGFAFARVVGGRIDMGAFESGATSADFDRDADVDGFDFLAWQRGFGTTAPDGLNSGGDADIDRDVDAADFAFWKSSFGSPAAIASASPAQAAALTVDDGASALSPANVDAALAYQRMFVDATARRPFRPRLTGAR